MGTRFVFAPPNLSWVRTDRRVLPSDAMLDVPYEELVGDFEPWARRVIDFCGLPWDDACLAFHETKRPVRTASASQVRLPIFKSSVGRWVAYKDLLEPLIRELPLERETASSRPLAERSSHGSSQATERMMPNG